MKCYGILGENLVEYSPIGLRYLKGHEYFQIKFESNGRLVRPASNWYTTGVTGPLAFGG